MSTSATGLFNTRFLSLCTLTFLALCNVSVFFNLHEYLLNLGFPTEQAGFLVGLYSAIAMLLYATISQRISLENAHRNMVLGIAIVFVCAVSYQFVHSFWTLAIVRMINGVGIFAIMASCTVVLVSIIPAEKSGTAFGVYSVALLAPYSVMPAISELAQPWIDNPTTLYMLTGCLMIPASLLVPMTKTTRHNRGNQTTKDNATELSGTARIANLRRKPVTTMLLVNSIYFTLFSGLFYLFKGFALSRGVANPGFFFTVQMGVMVTVRLFGGYLFDRISKVLLVTISMVITGFSFILLYLMPSPSWTLYIAITFGLGMGLCIPPLNSLMYLIAEPRLRGYNANMMMLTVHLGTFTGPFVGSMIITNGGYSTFLITAALLTICAALILVKANPEKEIRKMNGLAAVETCHCSQNQRD